MINFIDRIKKAFIKSQEKIYLDVYTKMPFGKYKGMEIIDILESSNADYVTWLLNQSSFKLSEKLIKLHDKRLGYKKYDENNYTENKLLFHKQKGV